MSHSTNPDNLGGARRDGYMMRRLAVDMNIPFITTIQAARAAVRAIEETRGGELGVKPLQAFHRRSPLTAGRAGPSSPTWR